MTATTTTAARRHDAVSFARCQHDADDAALRLHRAEQALHDAHTTHVDAWIAAAADRLHEAVAIYLAAVAVARD